MVDVNTQNKTISVNVSSSGVSSNVNASGDTTMYYSNKAREWAISNRIVDGVDYSSKYYAGRANQSALNAQSFAQSAQDSYNNFQDSVTDSLNTINNKVQEATENIEIQKQDTIAEIQDIATNQKEEIENLSEQEQSKIIDLGIDTRANVDLSNLSEVGEKHFLGKSQITNCILEVPQNIKLELNDGTLTLKAGSKVIVPNGFEADGTTPKFNEVLINRDVSQINASVGEKILFVTLDGSIVNTINLGKDVSGATDSLAGTTWHVWYDTTNNIIKRYATDANTYGQVSFPIAITTYSDTTTCSSIDQVFNGFGYIGSTIWVDKGVKGLISNSRNVDGTLNNIEFTTSQVLTRTFPNTETWNVVFGLNATSIGRLKDSDYGFNYEKNYVKNGTVGKWGYAIIGTATITNGVISNFQPKLPVRLVDWNDFEENAVLKDDLAECQVVVETYVNGNSWYRVWSDGWCEQGFRVAGQAQATTTAYNLLKTMANTNYTALYTENVGNTGNHQTKLYITNTTQVSVCTPSGGANSDGVVVVMGYIA